LKAVIYEEFGAPLKIANVPDPACNDSGAIIQVKASGICRSDWHGWRGHDPDINKFPHVPGHELSGSVQETGKDVSKFKVGDRVTIPFVAGCGTCPECKSGNHQICDNQYQPGFTGWGSFAEYVSINYADANLVNLPDNLDFVTAASLGCRFATSFRAVAAQGNVQPGQWVAVHGCGGVGLSAIMIAKAFGARVIAVDINKSKLDLAKSIGAEFAINANEEDVVETIQNISERGVHVSIDALGSSKTCENSIMCLRKRGRHVQVGLLAGDDYMPGIPMHQVIARELEIAGSHGMQAYKYNDMLKMITDGRLNPKILISGTVSLEEAPEVLVNMGKFESDGIVVIDQF
jgi:alcohol dehydrogenase